MSDGRGGVAPSRTEVLVICGWASHGSFLVLLHGAASAAAIDRLIRQEAAARGIRRSGGVLGDPAGAQPRRGSMSPREVVSGMDNERERAREQKPQREGGGRRDGNRRGGRDGGCARRHICRCSGRQSGFLGGASADLEALHSRCGKATPRRSHISWHLKESMIPTTKTLTGRPPLPLPLNMEGGRMRGAAGWIGGRAGRLLLGGAAGSSEERAARRGLQDVCFCPPRLLHLVPSPS